LVYEPRDAYLPRRQRLAYAGELIRGIEADHHPVPWQESSYDRGEQGRGWRQPNRGCRERHGIRRDTQPGRAFFRDIGLLDQDTLKKD
jgi:hypothetical protein